MEPFSGPLSATAGPTSLDGPQFSRLLRQLLPDLSRYARSLARDPDLAQDLVQEASTLAWRSRERFMIGTNFKAWLYRILRNAFLSHVRRGRIAKTDSYGDDLPEVPVAPSQETAIVLQDVKRHWTRLTVNQRRAIELVAIDGRSYEEAAEIEDVSVGTLKSRVSRGRHMLLSLLDGNVPTIVSRAVDEKACIEGRAADCEMASGPQLTSVPVRSTGSDNTHRSQIELLKAWRMQRTDLRAKAA